MSTVTKVESKRERFVRLAEARVSLALSALDKIESLANKSQYEYTDADVRSINESLGTGVAKVIAALESGEPAKAPKFKLGA